VKYKESLGAYMKFFLGSIIKILLLPFFLMICLTTEVNAEKFQRPLNIIILESMTLKTVQERADLLIKHLAEKYDLKPGVNVQYTRLNAKGEVNTGIVKLHETMDIVKPDLVISIATVASKATKKVLENTNIPQLFFLVTDPVDAGLISSFDAVHDNISGVSHMVDPNTKLSIITALLNSIDENRVFNIAFLNTTYPSAVSEKKYVVASIKDYPAINLIDIQADYLPEKMTQMVSIFEKKIKSLDKKAPIDFIWLSAGPNANRPEFFTAIKKKINKDFIAVANEEVVKRGGIISIASTPQSDVENISEYIYKALSGEPVSQMPVKYADGYEISLNLKSAKANDIVFPLDLLNLAGEKVYH